MANTLAMRATSLAVSAGLLGAVVLAALSASFVVQTIMSGDPPVITSIRPKVDPPPPPPPQPIDRHVDPITPQPLDIASMPPLTDNTAPPTTTTLPVFDPGPVTIENPHWLQVPRDLGRYYPRRAITRDVEGVVMLDCRVAIDGRLQCSVASESPTGWGFGEAALRIAADYRMSPATRNGTPVEGRYRMRVPFQIQ